MAVLVGVVVVFVVLWCFVVFLVEDTGEEIFWGF